MTAGTMTQVKVRASSGARQLATPTDLGPDDVRAIVGAVNRLVADAFALYVKTKNYHWHVAGPHFRDYHLLFDEQAHTILKGIDVLAERVRKLGGTTLRSIGHVAFLQTIADDDDEYVPALEMIHRLLEDTRRVAASQRAAIEVCDDHGDTPTGNILQEMLDQTERHIWFLFELAQDVPQSDEEGKHMAAPTQRGDVTTPRLPGTPERGEVADRDDVALKPEHPGNIPAGTSANPVMWGEPYDPTPGNAGAPGTTGGESDAARRPKSARKSRRPAKGPRRPKGNAGRLRR